MKMTDVLDRDVTPCSQVGIVWRTGRVSCSGRLQVEIWNGELCRKKLLFMSVEDLTVG